MAAITRNLPPHFGYSPMSILKTRLRRSAQESGARGQSVSVDSGGSARAVHLRFFFAANWARRLGVGTTRLRYLALGASTAW